MKKLTYLIVILSLLASSCITPRRYDTSTTIGVGNMKCSRIPTGNKMKVQKRYTKYRNPTMRVRF
jgi:hypothetical protein